MKYKIYLAGGLFNSGERFHNLQLEQKLTSLGWKVLLPQRAALNWVDDGGVNLAGIRADCMNMAADPENILVGCIDGPDADSGTSVEYGIAMESTGRAIVYRTDFRTAEDKEVGVNAMLTLSGSKLIYLPCFATELHELDSYYEELASHIDVAARDIP